MSWRAAHRALAPGIAVDRRWWAGVAAAWIVGAVAGVSPTAFQGYPAPGLAASAALGLVGVALLAPLVVLPLVALIATDDDAEQVAPAWLALGVDPARRLVARSLSAGLVSLRLLPVGAVAGLLAASGLAATGHDPVRWGWSGGPGAGACALGAALMALSWPVGGLVAAVAVTPARALLTLVVTWVVTGAVASLVHYSPGLATAFRLTPWMALWPFDPQSSASAQFAVPIPVATRLVGGSAWLGLLAAAAAGRRRRSPYPVPGERRRRRRPPAPSPRPSTSAVDLIG